MAITLATGEALVGEGNEVAHIDLLLGSKSGPVGEAFAHAFVNESEGHTNLLAVVTPNLPAKPDTVLSNKVTIKGAKQAVQLFGPAQAAVSRAVVDSVAEGVIPKDQVDDLCIIVSVFIHWEAEDDKKIYDWNYEAVKTLDRPRSWRRAEHRQGARGHAGRAAPVRRRRRGIAAAGHEPLIAQTGEGPLTGLRTVVTGASSGIGRAIAIAFAAGGGARRHRLLALVGGRAGARGSALVPFIPCCRRISARRTGCDSIVREAFAAFENVDVWVNNAGADVLTGEARSWPDERKLEVLLDVDLKATIRCSRLVAARMRPGGSILNIGWDHSTIDGMAGDDPELFAAVKAGVLGFSKSFARSVAPDVRVNVLCPGWVETAFGAGVDRAFYEGVAPRTPLRRWGRPEDIAGAAVWLASPAAAFVTGQAVNLNGGTVG